MDRIYILSAINLHKNTQADIQHKHQINNLRYNRCDTLIHHIRWLADAQRLRFSIETYDTAYFTSKETALKYARNNAADINEAGAYPYLVVYSRDLDVMYADAYDSDVTVLQFDRETRTYKDMDEDTLEKLVIANRFNIGLQHHPMLAETIDMYYQLPAGKGTSK